MLDKIRLLTPGPTPLPEAVRLALAKDMIHHRKKDFEALMESVQKKLKILFGASEPVLPLASSGTGAMTAAVYSLFEPGEKVLAIEAGKFGQRWGEIASSRGLEVVRLEIPWGECASAEDVEKELGADPAIKGVLVQLCETSTGVLQPVRDMAEITRKKGALLVVDGISAVGISPCPMDEWGIDCLLTGSQKGLLLPPGLSLIALSERAWAKAENIRPGCFYFDLPAERKALAKNQTHFTSPINLIYGLDASLDLLLADGLDAVYRKQWALTMLVRDGCAAMGLSPLAKENFSWGVTAIELPEKLSGSEILRFAQKNYHVFMAGGQDRLKDRIIRIGHMGWVDWADCLAGLYALAMGVAAQGGSQAKGSFMEAAMDAYNKAYFSWDGTASLRPAG